MIGLEGMATLPKTVDKRHCSRLGGTQTHEFQRLAMANGRCCVVTAGLWILRERVHNSQAIGLSSFGS